MRWSIKSENNLPIVGENAPTANQNAPTLLANRRKLKAFDAVLEVRNADKSIIYLPRQHLQIADGGIYDEGYGGKNGDRG